MVGRRRNQGDTRRGMAGLGNPRIDLFTGQMAALAGLCTLGHFNLQFLGADEIFRRHAEAARSHLLDGAALVGLEPGRILAALAGVGLAAQPVHGQGQTFVGLLGNGAVGHGASLKPLNDFADRLHLFDGDGTTLRRGKGQQAPQGVGGGFVIHQMGILLEHLIIPVAGRLLEQPDDLRIVHMVFLLAAAAEPLVTVGLQGGVIGQAQGVKGMGVVILDALGNLLQTHAADAGDGVGEIALHNILSDADGLENLRRLVRLDGGDTHFGRHLDNTMEDSAVVIVHGNGVVLVQQALMDGLADALVGQIGVDGSGAIAQEGGEVVDVAGLRRFQNDGNGGTLLGANQMLFQCRHSQQRRNSHMVFIHAPVGENQNVGTIFVGPVTGHKQMVQRPVQPGILIIEDGHGFHFEAGPVHVLDFQQIHIGEDGVVDLQDVAVLGPVLQQIAVGAHINRGIGDGFLPDGVDGRVGHLGKHLLEIVKEGLVFFRQDRQGQVVAHGRRRFGAVAGHGENGVLDILIGVGKSLLQSGPVIAVQGDGLLVGDGQVLEGHQMLVQPLAVGQPGGIGAFQLVVLDDFSLDRIHQQHFAGLEAGFADHGLRRNIQNAHLGRQNQRLILGYIVAGGPQTVAVQQRAHHIAVGKDDGRRAVPRLHHGGVIVVHVPLFPVHDFILLPCLRDGNHHSQGQVHAVHGQKLDGVVQHGRVGARAVDNRQNLVNIVLHNPGGHGLLPRQHAVRIAPDGVDFAVVENHAVGVGPLPAGIGVGGEPGVDQGDGRLVVLALQVLIEPPQLTHQEHPLIDNGPAGERRHIGVVVALLELPADDVQLPVEGNAPLHVLGPLHKALENGGHAVQRLLAQDLRMDRHLPPAQEADALLVGDNLQHFLGLIAQEPVLRHKEHAHAVVPGAAQGDTAGRRRLFEEFMGNLQQDTHAVAGFSGGVLTGAVLQLFHDFQRIIHGAVVGLAVDTDDGTDAAGVMLQLGDV